MRVIVLAIAMLACSDPGPVPLIEGSGWSAADASLDPQAEHGGTPCYGGFAEELGGVEIDTAICDYAVLQHALIEGFSARDTLGLNWWHSDLVAEDPGVGHVLLTIGDETLYEAEVDIPTGAQAYLLDLEPGFAAQAGDPLILHLHNHGYNTWNLFDLSRL